MTITHFKIFNESGVTTRDLIGPIHALPQKMGDKNKKEAPVGIPTFTLPPLSAPLHGT
jgi:hypothetical protein